MTCSMCFYLKHAVGLFIKMEENKDWDYDDIRDDLFCIEEESDFYSSD